MSSVQTEFKDPVAGIKAIANAFVELVYQSGPEPVLRHLIDAAVSLFLKGHGHDA